MIIRVRYGMLRSHVEGQLAKKWRAPPNYAAMERIIGLMSDVKE
jgi:hypothetical protein